MKFVGAHVSAAGGVDQAVLRAHEIKATAFALLLKISANGKQPPLSTESIDKFKKIVKSMAMVLHKFYHTTAI